MKYLKERPRRWRVSGAMRELAGETELTPSSLVAPFFVVHGKDVRRAVRSMPGVFQYSIDNIVKEARAVRALGIPAVVLFGIPARKDERASGAYARDGVVQQAVRAIKEKVPGIAVITDVCLCEYMSHGHCGVVKSPPSPPSPPLVKGGPGGDFVIDNDATLGLLAKTAVSHAEAGADVVAPSDMMDGRVKAIRTALDERGFKDTAILSYAVKYASAFYGPFRDAAGSAPRFGDRATYQMDPRNAREALREVRLDIAEGADAIIVKPAMPYLDVISKVRAAFDVPVAAYQVSGEYAMMQAAFQKGWLDPKKVVVESLIAIKRAGADFILTYFAKEAARIGGISKFSPQAFPAPSSRRPTNP